MHPYRPRSCTRSSAHHIAGLEVSVQNLGHVLLQRLRCHSRDLEMTRVAAGQHSAFTIEATSAAHLLPLLPLHPCTQFLGTGSPACRAPHLAPSSVAR